MWRPIVVRGGVVHLPVERILQLQWALDGRGIVVRSQWEIGSHIERQELVPLLVEWTPMNADTAGAIWMRVNPNDAFTRSRPLGSPPFMITICDGCHSSLKHF
jgi:hypothetical protein